MRSVCSRHAVLVAAFVVAWLAAPVWAGDINPPAGAVVGTMKPLDQVEPRTPISTTTTPGTSTSVFRITQPGSYYLVGNVAGASGKSGIEVSASDVTLDLSGFRMLGVAGSLAAITVDSGFGNFAVRNGTIRSWAGGGISAASCQGCIVEDLRCISNTGAGLNLGTDAMVRRCYCQSNTGAGIQASLPSLVTDCVSQSNGAAGVTAGDHSVLSNTVIVGNSGAGANLGAGAIASGVVAAQNSIGFSASSGFNAVNCTARNNSSHGFFCFGAAFTNCTSTVNTGDGFNTDAAILTGCRATSNARGIFGGNNSLVQHSLTISNSTFGIECTSGYVLSNACAQDCASNPGELREIKFDTRGRADGNHLYSANANLWGVGGPAAALMIRNSLNGGFVTTFGGTEASDVTSSNIDTDNNPNGNYDLP